MDMFDSPGQALQAAVKFRVASMTNAQVKRTGSLLV
jgi:hypothetical protein